MLYALTRPDGSVGVTWLIPQQVIVGGKTLPITMVDGANTTLHALDDLEIVTFPLPSPDQRTYETDSIPGVTLVFDSIQKIIDANPDTIVSYEKITVADIPPSRSYRNAWMVSGKTLVHDMTKARDIHRDKLREARKPMLEVLDVAYQRADEQDDGPLKRRIAADKQKLRDITSNPLIGQAADVAALERLTVEYLLAHAP